MAKARKPADKYRDSKAAEMRERYAGAKEIGPPPKVKNLKRWRAACKSLRTFLETYFPETFAYEWSNDHVAMIERLQRCVIDGGQFCSAMPRGSGKTSVSIRAALWALLTGRRRFVIMIAATEKLAEKMIAVLRSELQFNEKLAEDFPEVCHPIRALENEVRRQAGQTVDGVNTMMRFASDEIVLPTMKGSKASGSVVRACGLTGSVRGQIATTASGQTIRPDLVICDDPQTRDSAKSPTQNKDREALINGDVMGLAGPGKKMACVMNCTVIYKNDLSDLYLNPEKYPAWGGRRAKLLYAMPTNMELWDQYADIRRQSLRELGNNANGNAFYERHREEMDKGAVPGWPARFDSDELSAIQNAMNLRIDVPKSFASEYQNDPESDALAQGAKELTADAIAGRLSGLDRCVVPRECGTVTAFVDPGGYLHWWLVAAWGPRFGGTVLDYGCWPRQNRTHFVASDARPRLDAAYAGMDKPQQVFAGLRDLCAELAGRKYFQEVSGAELRCERMMIDCGYESTAVYQFIRQLQMPGCIVLPSKGIARSSTQAGIMNWKPRPGEKRGHFWRQTVSEMGRGQMIQFDPDAWKSFVYEGLTVPQGGPTGITLWGKKADAHGMISEHLSAEYSEPVTLRGQTFDKWQVMPDRGENHWLDCLVGAAVAASVHGVEWRASESIPERGKGKPISLRELQEKRRKEKERRNGAA